MAIVTINFRSGVNVLIKAYHHCIARLSIHCLSRFRSIAQRAIVIVWAMMHAGYHVSEVV